MSFDGRLTVEYGLLHPIDPFFVVAKNGRAVAKECG